MYKLQYIIFFLFALFIMIFPQSLRHAIFKSIGTLLYYTLRYRRKIISINLNLAFKNSKSKKEKDIIAKRCFQNILLEVLINIEIYFKGVKDFDISVKNEELIKDIKSKNRAIIYIAYHYNSLELGGVALSRVSKTLHIVQKVDNPYIDKFIKRSRERHGLKTIPMEKAVKQLVSQMKKRDDISLIVDQSVGPISGIVVKMFDEKIMHVTTASYLARKFNAVLVPIHVRQKDSKSCEITFQHPIAFTKTKDQKADIAYLTQMQATILENMIKEDPKPWFWCHKRWKDTYLDIYK